MGSVRIEGEALASGMPRARGGGMGARGGTISLICGPERRHERTGADERDEESVRFLSVRKHFWTKFALGFGLGSIKNCSKDKYVCLGIKVDWYFSQKEKKLRIMCAHT